MSRLVLGLSRPRTLVAASLIVVVLTAIASAQIGNAPKAGSPRRVEFLHQEVEAANITQSLNDFDAQGWEIFQLIPVWQIKNENAETLLSPRSYEVFGRRPVAPR